MKQKKQLKMKQKPNAHSTSSYLLVIICTLLGFMSACYLAEKPRVIKYCFQVERSRGKSYTGKYEYEVIVDSINSKNTIITRTGFLSDADCKINYQVGLMFELPLVNERDYYIHHLYRLPLEMKKDSCQIITPPPHETLLDYKICFRGEKNVTLNLPKTTKIRCFVFDIYNEAIQSHYIDQRVFYCPQRKLIVKSYSFSGNSMYRRKLLSQTSIYP